MFYFISMGVLHACIYLHTTCCPGAYGDHNGSGSLELELEIAVSIHVSAWC